MAKHSEEDRRATSAAAGAMRCSGRDGRWPELLGRSDVQGFARVHRACGQVAGAAADRGRRSVIRDRRHHRGRGRHAGRPGAPLRRHQGVSARLPHLHQCGDPSTAGSAGARSRSGVAAARCAQGLDGEAQDAQAAAARAGAARRLPGKHHDGRRRRPRQAAGAHLAPPRRRALHRLGLDRHHARSRRRLDQRLDLSGAGAWPEQGDGAVRPRRPARRDHRQEILGSGQDLSGGGGQRRGPGAVHRRLRVSAGRPVGVRVRRRHQGRADRDLSGAADRPAAARACRDRARGRAPADERGDPAGRTVRRVHRLLRGRRPPRPGHGGDRDPSPRRSDPARLAAAQAAALPFRAAVPRRHHLGQPGCRRRDRRGRRLAARLAADDRGGAQAALRRPCQARRAGRCRAQLHGAAGGGGGRGRRSVEPG